jgi:protein-tyrosine-phosphatase
MGEALLRARLAGQGVAAVVGSAGFFVEGEPATDDAVATMQGLGLDISAHRSRVVDAAMVAAADLIVTMTSQHVAELAVRWPTGWGRAFQVRDLLQRIDQVGPVRRDEDPRAWVERLGAGRTPADVLAAPASDDVADPIGLPRAAYQRTAAELDELFTRLAAVLRPQR